MTQITQAKYSADGSVTAGPIEGQTWSGITPASRFWPVVQEWVGAGNTIEPYDDPNTQPAKLIQQAPADLFGGPTLGELFNVNN